MQRLKLSSARVNKKNLLNTPHDVENKMQDMLTVSRKQEDENAIAAIEENPKFFYKYALHLAKPNKI